MSVFWLMAALCCRHMRFVLRNICTAQTAKLYSALSYRAACPGSRAVQLPASTAAGACSEADRECGLSLICS